MPPPLDSSRSSSLISNTVGHLSLAPVATYTLCAASVRQRFNRLRAGHTGMVRDERREKKVKKKGSNTQRRQGKGSGRSRRSGLQLSLNPSTYRKERKMIILNERHFSVDLQGLSKPKPTFPLGEGRVWRGWHGIHRIIW